MKSNKKNQGLTDAQVLESRQKHGVNILTPPEKDPLWKQFLEKFSDPLIIILMIAGALSIGIACYEFFGLNHGAQVFFEPAGIFVAILLATGLAFYFELQADKEFTILNQVNDDEAVEVIRNGNVTQIPRKDVVVGDIVILNTGEEIPADGELIEATQLYVDESTLTGELICEKFILTDKQLAVYKYYNHINDDIQIIRDGVQIQTYKQDLHYDDILIIDNKQYQIDDSLLKAAKASEDTYPPYHVMKGTKVMEGHGIFQVLSVGDKTEQGKVFEAAQIDDSVKTPLNEQLGRLSDWITKLSYGFAALIVIGRLAMFFMENGTDCLGTAEQISSFIAYVLQTLMIAVTLIVVAVPEGLPMAVTLSLAYSMRRMLKTNNLVRKMHACETMGATTVICTDKTGTLTQNQMKVDEIKVYAEKLDSNIFYEGLAVNSTAALDFSDKKKPQVLGNPTEGALLLWLNEKGTDYRTLRDSAKVVEELPFSTERKYMATVVESSAMPGKKIIYIKGAPEIIYSLCNSADVDKNTVEQQLLAYQNRAMRTLGFAYQILESNDQTIVDSKVVANSLHFIAVVAIADPVRVDVPDAVKECINAGIKVRIVTGDTPGTAKEIGRQIGLWDETDSDKNIITGPEFAALSDEELLSRVQDLKIIARARPMDKKRLVETLQKLNQVVAVTGDGTNDAPALNAAHVGLSMGDGTSVAKEASDITIIDNSFSSIGKAVMWGRSLYQNIQRFLLFQLTVNVTACFLVLFGAFMGTESPLTVTQMLWINLIMDTFAAMALASLPPSSRVMNDKPRDRNAFILNKDMIVNIAGVGLFFFAMLIGMLYMFQHADITQLTDLISLRLGEKGHVTEYELTLLFTIFVMTHFFYLFNARAYKTGRSALNFKGCGGLLTIVIIILFGQIAMVEIPGIQEFFNVCSLKLQDWAIIILGSSLVLWVRELKQFIFKK